MGRQATWSALESFFFFIYNYIHRSERILPWPTLTV